MTHYIKNYGRPLTKPASNYFVDNFVAYVREMNYPHMDTDELDFENGGRTALCSSNESPDLIDYMEQLKNGSMPTHDGEYVCKFDGGVYTIRHHDFWVLVDGHLYFFDF